MDPHLMPGVFFNLILNAIEHVENLADPAEKVVLVELDDREGMLEARISNRGAPVSPERLKNFFQEVQWFRERAGETGAGNRIRPAGNPGPSRRNPGCINRRGGDDGDRDAAVEVNAFLYRGDVRQVALGTSFPVLVESTRDSFEKKDRPVGDESHQDDVVWIDHETKPLILGYFKHIAHDCDPRKSERSES